MRSFLVSSLCALTLLLAAGRGLAADQTAPPPPGGGGHKDVGIGLRIGTTGFGLEVSKLITSHLGGRVGANYFKFSTTKSQTDVSYDASLKLQAFSALVDLYPWSRGGFHITGGIMTNPVKVSGTGQPAADGDFTINDNPYTAAEVGTLTGEVKYPGVDPYLGIGMGTAARKDGPLGFAFDLGVAIGTAKVSLDATGAASNPALASDLQALESKTQHDVQKYAKLYPVLQFGLVYRF
jgi:hypothetical protein